MAALRHVSGRLERFWRAAGVAPRVCNNELYCGHVIRSIHCRPFFYHIADRLPVKQGVQLRVLMVQNSGGSALLYTTIKHWRLGGVGLISVNLRFPRLFFFLIFLPRHAGVCFADDLCATSQLVSSTNVQIQPTPLHDGEIFYASFLWRFFC